MSVEFVKLVSELCNERYTVQAKSIIDRKIPCGFFYGFSLPAEENFEQAVKILRNSGFNLTCICVIDDNQKEFLEKIFLPLNLNVSALKLDELQTSTLKPSIILHINPLHPTGFKEYFDKCGIEMLQLKDAHIAEKDYLLYMEHLPELYEVHELFADEESKKVFRAFIKGRITQKVNDFRFASEPQYFLEGFLPVEGDIAIDGGAFDGATSRDFAMQGAKVYAFEMSADNYKNCLTRAEKYGFTIENIGLSDRETTDFYLTGGGPGCYKTNPQGGGSIGNFIDLDTYVMKKELPRVDYIKLDIEGSELDMLHGAFKTISRWKPKMAISAYHKPVDLWTLANYVKSIRPDYEFKFRHYKIDCTDYFLNEEERKILEILDEDYFLSSNCESVLYCR